MNAAPERPFLTDDEARLVMAPRAPGLADSPYAMAILSGLQRQPHVYQGTVDPVTVARRRAKNRAARRARRINRLAAIR